MCSSPPHSVLLALRPPPARPEANRFEVPKHEGPRTAPGGGPRRTSGPLRRPASPRPPDGTDSDRRRWGGASAALFARPPALSSGSRRIRFSHSTAATCNGSMRAALSDEGRDHGRNLAAVRNPQVVVMRSFHAHKARVRKGARQLQDRKSVV